MPQNPTPDFINPGVQIAPADITGIVKQTLPVIKVDNDLTHTIPLLVLFPPINYRLFNLELRATDGASVLGSTVNSIYVRYPNRHDDFTAWWALPRCPLDQSLSRIWLGGNMDFAPTGDTSTSCITNSPQPNILSFEHPWFASSSGPFAVFDTSSAFSTRAWSLGHTIGSSPTILSGEALIGAVQMDLEIGITELRQLEGRAVTIQFLLQGVVQASQTFMVVSDHQKFPTYGSLKETLPLSGAQVNLVDGNLNWEETFFSCTGPGLSMDMKLNYSSGLSAFWKGVRPNLNYKDSLYSPFGHGWTNLYTMHVFKHEEERSTRPSDTPHIVSTFYYFQDINGKLIQFIPGTLTRNNLVSPSFDCIYTDLRLVVLPAGGYELWSQESPFTAHFDAEGRLTKWERMDSGRPITLQYTGSQITIEDAQKRTARMTLQNERVTVITDPKGRNWKLTYDDDTLTKIANGSSTAAYEFDYDPISFQLTEIVGPAINTQILYRGTGTENRWASASVQRVTEGRFYADFNWNIPGAIDLNFDVVIRYPLGRQIRHLSRQPVGQFWVWWINTGGLWQFMNLGWGPDSNSLDSPEAYDANRQLRKLPTPQNSLQPGSKRTRLASINLRTGMNIQFEYEDKPNAFDLVSKITGPPDEPNGVRAVTIFRHNDDGDVIEQEDPIGIITENIISTTTGEVGLIIEKIIDPGNEDIRTQYKYDEMGNLVEEIGPERDKTTFTYDELDRIIFTEEADGSWQKMEYDKDTGLMYRITTPAGIVMELEYTNEGMLQRDIDPATGPASFQYNDCYELLQEVHDQMTVTYQYDQLGRIEQITEQAGSNQVVTKHKYDPWGNIIETSQQCDSDPPEVATFQFDDYNRLQKVNLPSVTVNGQILNPTVTNTYENPARIINGYGAHQDLIKVEEEIAPGATATIEYEYDLGGRLVGVKKGNPPAGFAREEFVYDLADNLVQHKGDNFNYVFVSTRPRGPRGRTLREAKLDTAGRVTSLTDPGNPNVELVTVVRDKEGRVIDLKLPDQNGNLVSVEQREYTNGILTKVTDENGEETNIKYDGSGRPSTIIDPYGTSITYEFDVADRLVKNTIDGFDGTRSETLYKYRASDGQLEEISQLRNGSYDTTRFEYNAFGLLEKEINPLGFSISYKYSTQGYLIERTDGMLRTTKFEYDEAGNLKKAIYPGGWEVECSYDTKGRMLHQEDQHYRKELIRDGLGRVEKEIYTDKISSVSRFILFRYDDYGALAEMEDDMGYITSLHRDSNNQISKIEFGTATLAEEIAAFTRDLQGRVVEKRTKAFTVLYDWNATGALKSMEAQNGSNLLARIEYRMDATGRKIQASYAHLNITLDWRYDGVGRLIEETIKTQSGFPIFQETFRYDEAGNMITSNANGISSQRTYNAFNQLINVAGSEIIQVPAGSLVVGADSELDSAHGVDLIKDGVAPGHSGAGQAFVSAATLAEHWVELSVSQNAMVSAIELSLPQDHGLPRQLDMSYQDPATQQWKQFQIMYAQGARITPVTAGSNFSTIEPGGYTIRIIFTPIDFSAIRISQPLGAAPLQPAIPAHLNALAISEVRLFNGISKLYDYIYDANGNLTSDGIRTFIYDHEDRLVGIQEPGKTDMIFEYGPDGALIVEKDALRNTEVTYRYVEGERYAKFDSNGNLLQQFIPGEQTDMNSGLISNGVLYNILTDPIGTVQEIASATQLHEVRLSDAWGNKQEEVINQQPGAWNGITNKGFLGRPDMGDEEIIDLRARAYGSNMQRFLSPDPEGIQESPNCYIYALNDPVNLFDRNGRIFSHILGGLASVAVGYAISKVRGKDYDLTEAAIDFGVGFASSGLSALGKCAKLGSTIHQLSQGGRIARTAARAAPIAASTALGVAGDYATAKLKGEEFNIVTSLLFNTAGAFVGSLFSRPYCFAAGTLVETPSGAKPIEAIAPGDLVITQCPGNRERKIKPVKKVLRDQTTWMLELNVILEQHVPVTKNKLAEPVLTQKNSIQRVPIGDERVQTEIDFSICCTPDHLIYVATKGWTIASELESNDLMILSDGSLAYVATTENVPVNATVYNLEIEEGHTYFVTGKEHLPGIWVHNNCVREEAKESSGSFFGWLNEWRKKFGAEKASAATRGKHTFALGMIEGSNKMFWGRNGWAARFRKYPTSDITGFLSKIFIRKGKNLPPGINAFARTHAEACVMDQIYRHVVSQGGKTAGKKVVLIVDKAMCSQCINRAGIARMARRMDLAQVVIVWKEGKKSGVWKWHPDFSNGPGIPKEWKKEPIGNWVTKLMDSVKHRPDWLDRPLNLPPG